MDAGVQFSVNISCNKGTSYIYWQLSLHTRTEGRHPKLHTNTPLTCTAGHREPGCLLPQPPEPGAGCHDGKPSRATGPSLELWLQLWKQKKTQANTKTHNPLKNANRRPNHWDGTCHLCRQQDFNGSLPRKGYMLATLSFAQSSSCACMQIQTTTRVKHMRGSYTSWLSNKSNFLNSKTVQRNKACQHREQHTEGYRRCREDTAHGWRGSQERKFW